MKASNKYIGSFSPYLTAAHWARNQNITLWQEPECTSTNDIAKEESPQLNTDLKLYLTDRQLKGRGRRDSSWENGKPHSQLLSTWSMSMAMPPKQHTGPLVGLSVYRAFTQVWPDLPFSLKAPNDIFMGGNKIGGILVECLSTGMNCRLIVGIGINVFDSPPEVDRAGHLAMAYHRPQELSVTRWIEFQDALFRNLIVVKGDLLKPRLSERERTSLKQALNGHGEAVKEVMTNGDLVTPDRTIPWQEL